MQKEPLSKKPTLFVCFTIFVYITSPIISVFADEYGEMPPIDKDAVYVNPIFPVRYDGTQIMGDSSEDVNIEGKLDSVEKEKSGSLSYAASSSTSFDPNISDLANPKNITRPTARNEQSTGSFDYRYPIDVPPGRNGVTPYVAVRYNSQDLKNSIVGFAWDIDIPYIERVNKTGVENLYTNNTFTSSEQGELGLVSGSVYKPRTTETDHSQYKYQSNAWIVTKKDGTRYFYGTTATSRLDNPLDTNKVYRWMLDEIRDTNGNSILYTYTKHSNQIYPSSILYTKNGSETPPYEVTFSYTSSIPTSSYKSGFLVRTEQKLSEIQVSFNGNWIKKYTFTYNQDPLNQRNRLSDIGLQAKNEAGIIVTYPSTTFEYQKNLSPNQGALISDPISNRILDQTYGAIFVDVNGDSLVDMVRSSCSNCYYPSKVIENEIYINNGNQLILDTNWQIPSGVFFYVNDVDVGYRFVDVNGDLMPDIVYKTDTNPAIVYLHNGSGWTLAPSWTLPHRILQSSTIMPTGQHFIDYTADGFVDSLVFTWLSSYPFGSQHSHAKNLSNGSWQSTSYSSSAGYAFTTFETRFGLYISDINFDGLPDFIQMYDDNTYNPIKKIGFNRGDATGFSDTTDISTTPVGYFFPGFQGDRRSTWYLGDVNNDGLDDAFHPYDGMSVSTAILGLNAFSTASNLWGMGPHPFAPGYPYGRQFVDINGDGALDSILVYTISGGGFNSMNYINQAKNPELLTKITHPEGGSTSVTYTRTNAPVSGVLKHPKLPMMMNLVSSINIQDNNGNSQIYNYEYEGGELYAPATPSERKFAGFSTVTETSPNAITKTYYHQGNASNTTLGEFSDSRAKIGKVYRREIYDLSSQLYQTEIVKWEDTLVSSDVDFVFPTRVVTQSYDGNGTHKDKAEEYVYDQYGNIEVWTFFGEVSANTDGSFTDIGSDKSTENVSYALNVPSYLVGFPSHSVVTDQSGSKVRETKSYYDNLSFGSITKGNQTKQEQWKSGTDFISREKTYNSLGLITSETDPRGKFASYTYDARNLYPASIVDPLSHATHYEYDYIVGKIKQITDKNNLIFQKKYDGLGRILEEKIPDPVTPSNLVTKTSYVYTDAPNTMSTKRTDYLDGSNGVDTYEYFDGLGRLIQERKEAETNFSVRDITYNSSGLAHKESFPYNSSGSSKTSPTGTATLYTTYTYDPLQRIKTVTNAAGVVTSIYDNWITSTTDQNGKQKNYHFDAYERLVQVDEIASGNTYSTQYSWNLNNNLTRITDALGNIRDFSYDGLGRQLSAGDTHALSDSTFGVWSYAHDEAGNITQKTSPRGQVINYTYDDINRPLTEDFSGGTGTEITYSYDLCTRGVGQLCSVNVAGSVATTYTYSPYGTVATENRTIGADTYNTSYVYDRQGNTTQVTYPDDAIVKYTFNNAGLVDKIEKKEVGGAFEEVLSNIDYNPLGQITIQTFPNTVTTTNTYDTAKLYRLTRKLTQDTTSQKFQDLNYTYDAVGNITKIIDDSILNGAKEAVYGYDDLHRLTSATITDVPTGQTPYTQNYTYSAIGNITSGPAGAYVYAGSTGTNYANPHAATSIDGTTYTYDQNGNLTHDGITTYAWDYRDQLVDTDNGTVSIQYTYDHTGQRVSYDDGSTTTIYPNKLYATDGDKETKYIYLKNDLIATVEAGGVAAGNSLAVNNGDFSDTTGMTNLGGGWYSGTPPHWSISGATGYSVNNGLFNLDGKGTISQILGTVTTGGEMLTVNFSYGDFWNGGYYVAGENMLTVELWDTTANTLLATKTVKNIAAYQTLASDSLSNPTPATVGNTLEVRFIGLEGTGPAAPGQAAAIDNVSVSVVSDPSPKIYYQHTDHLTGGNVVTNASGSVVQLLDYYPFGGVRINESTSFDEKHQYAGSEFDGDTGLNYMQARYYQSGAGRFISQDQAFLALGDESKMTEIGGRELTTRLLTDPQQLNSYSYVANNPLIYVDPSGKFLDTAIDGGAILYDIYSLGKNLWNGDYEAAKTDGWALGADVLSAALPGVTGGGAVVRTVKNSVKVVDKTGDVAKRIKSLEDGIKSYEKRIQEHKNEIESVRKGTYKYDMDKVKGDFNKYKEGLIEHWQKEINTFQDNITKNQNEINSLSK